MPRDSLPRNENLARCLRSPRAVYEKLLYCLPIGLFGDSLA